MSMVRRTIPALMAALLVGIPLAQAAPVDEAVAAKVEAFRTAQVEADAKAFGALAAPELSYSHSDGRVEDKAAFIAAATNGKSKFTKLEYRNPAIRVVGDVATVRFNWVGEQTAVADGKVSNTNLHILMVWAKQGADWRLLARSATRL